MVWGGAFPSTTARLSDKMWHLHRWGIWCHKARFGGLHTHNFVPLSLVATSGGQLNQMAQGFDQQSWINRVLLHNACHSISESERNYAWLVAESGSSSSSTATNEVGRATAMGVVSTADDEDDGWKTCEDMTLRYSDVNHLLGGECGAYHDNELQRTPT